MTRRLRLLHKASLYAVVAVAFVSLAAGGALHSATTVAFTVGVAASWFVDAFGWLEERHNPWTNALIVALFAGSVLQLVATQASFFTVGTQFLLALLVLRLLSRNGARHELQIYALALLVIAAATAVNEDLSFGLAFGGFVLTGTFSLALFHLKDELDEHPTGAPPGSARIDSAYLGVLVGISALIFGSSLLVFFGFPRIGLGFFESQDRDGQDVSGFSDSVELGSHGAIRENRRVALRVDFPDGRPPDVENLHWRTATFDYYDGRSWARRLSDQSYPLRSSNGTYDLGRYLGDRMPTEAPKTIPRRLRLYVEPLQTDLLPTLWPTRTVEFGRSSVRAIPGDPRTGNLLIDRYGDLSHTVPSRVGMAYTLETSRRPPRAQLRDVDSPIPTDHESLQPFLQLPGESERIGELARRITEPDQTPFAKAIAIEDHLEKEYTYTTDLPRVDENRPVESFLFETKRGHCEYYATATVLMLRELDVPARMVNGFLGGKWNAVGDYLAVRQGDAHSWVELYLPEYGWVPIDPTPAASLRAESPSARNWISESYDALRMLWFQRVIEYDLRTQMQLLREGREWIADRRHSSTQEGSDNDGEAPSVPWSRIVFWAGLALLCLGAAAAARRSKGRGDWTDLLRRALIWSAASTAWVWLFVGLEPAPLLGGALAAWSSIAVGATLSLLGALSDEPPPTQLFRRIERVAEAADLGRNPGEPPGEFLDRLADAEPELRPGLVRFRRHYLASRFGGAPLSAATRREMRETVEHLEQSLPPHT